MKFEELELNESLHKAIKDIGYIELTPIQNEAIPHGLAGKDITGLAQTGTGKTLAFLIPAINRLMNPSADDEGNKQKFPAIIVLAPTRELVMQISEEATRLLKYTDIQVAAIIGGTDYKTQQLSLNEKTGVIVATPGRLIDLVKSGKCNIADISIMIIDEADRMFDMGFFQDLRYIIHHCKERKQTMLFSATLSYDVMMLASRFLNEPVNVEIEPEKMITEKIEQMLYHLGEEEKLAYLVNLILNDTREDQGIIFTNFKSNIARIVNSLRFYGISATGISSQLDQKKRMRLLRDFKEGKYRIMVATDVASRGIDVENIGIVYNYDMPMDTGNYVHRIGRTARAGRAGVSISFTSEKDYQDLDRIEKFLKTQIPVKKTEEAYLKFPQGEFQKFEGEDVFTRLESKKGEKYSNRIKKSGDKRSGKNRSNQATNGFSDKKGIADGKPTGKPVGKPAIAEHSFVNQDDRKKYSPEQRKKEGLRKDRGFAKRRNERIHSADEKIHPVDEAILYLQKADSFLGTNGSQNPGGNSRNENFNGIDRNSQPINREKAKNDKFNKKRKHGSPKRNYNEGQNFSKDAKLIYGRYQKKYDKSKRNLFDINDFKEIPDKKSVWQKIKTIFGG